LLKRLISISALNRPRSNVRPEYVSVHQFIARLASEIFLISLPMDLHREAAEDTASEIEIAQKRMDV